jgi:predicted N-formylglutamate amidohydrolase
VFLAVARPWNAGALFDRAEDFSVPVHGDDRGIPAILIEISNDQIRDTAGVEAWATRLNDVLGLG